MSRVLRLDVAADFEVYVVNARPGDERRLAGCTFSGHDTHPPRVHLDDGTTLLVKDIRRGPDGRPVRYDLLLPPLDASAN